MPTVRVTATLPPALLKAADRHARQQGLSRSAVLSEGLRRYLAAPIVEPPGAGAPPAPPPVVAAASDTVLLAELGRRLARAGAPGEGAPSVGTLPVAVDRVRLAQLAQRYGVRELSLFGSVLRADFTPDSDIDVLVEFEPGRTPGLAFVSLAEELSALFGGRRVDLVTTKSLHPLLRDEILRSAVVQP